ncbi:MAG: thiaminase II [Candidatus Latescibacterota bacterium]|nr:MAG: thiaminase II [Candidatus Latescibacterota bacterium]
MYIHSLSSEFREQSGSVWSAILEHPFVRGIGKGDLSRDRFEFYLKQDYVYLTEFGRVFALAAAKSEQLADMSHFDELLHATLKFEMDLHRRTCADYGIPPEDLETVEPALVTTAYTNLLIRTCYEGRLADILAVLLPCEQGYVEVATHLKEKGLPSKKHYRDWIETYTSKEFRELAGWVGDTFDRLAVDASDPDKARWYRLYLASSRFELLFFDMGWKMESWPKPIPL